ncbi:MAG: hypothetical protein ACXAEI_15530 [Candidatus Hodarchaeales archaeon]|jgi:hypothetical protein
MQNDSVSFDGALIDGLVITVFLDQGPANIYNSSSLHNNDAYNMAIWNLPTLETEVPLPFGEICACGIIPTQTILASTYLFYLPAPDSVDPRMAANGRLVIFWLITRSETVLGYESKVKGILKQILRFYKIGKDSDLYNKEILQRIDEKLTTAIRRAAKKKK